jgi:hypothetical protein
MIKQQFNGKFKCSGRSICGTWRTQLASYSHDSHILDNKLGSGKMKRKLVQRCKMHLLSNATTQQIMRITSSSSATSVQP